MLDNETIQRILAGCWNDLKKEWLVKEEKHLSWIREKFYSRLPNAVPQRTSRNIITMDHIVAAIQEFPALTIQPSPKGIRVIAADDTFGIEIYKDRNVSVHSVNFHTGWNAVMWEPQDTARMLDAMGSLSLLNIPYEEAHQAYLKEEERRKQIDIEFWEKTKNLVDAVTAAIQEGKDVTLFKDQYTSLDRERFMKKGDVFTDNDLEMEWEQFVLRKRDYVKKERANAARQKKREERKQRKQAAIDACLAKISDTLGRECTYKAKSPFANRYWDEYDVALTNGQVVRFKDYSAKVGDINVGDYSASVMAMVPILDELSKYSTSKLSFGTARAQRYYWCEITYTKNWASHLYGKLVEKAKGDEILLYLTQRLWVEKLPVLPTVTQRSIKLHCLRIKSSSEAVSFTLKKPGSEKEADALIDVLSRFNRTWKKFPCEIAG